MDLVVISCSRKFVEKRLVNLSLVVARFAKNLIACEECAKLRPVVWSLLIMLKIKSSTAGGFLELNP